MNEPHEIPGPDFSTNVSKWKFRNAMITATMEHY